MPDVLEEEESPVSIIAARGLQPAGPENEEAREEPGSGSEESQKADGESRHSAQGAGAAGEGERRLHQGDRRAAPRAAALRRRPARPRAALRPAAAPPPSRRRRRRTPPGPGPGPRPPPGAPRATQRRPARRRAPGLRVAGIPPDSLNPTSSGPVRRGGHPKKAPMCSETRAPTVGGPLDPTTPGTGNIRGSPPSGSGDQGFPAPQSPQGPSRTSTLPRTGTGTRERGASHGPAHPVLGRLSHKTFFGLSMLLLGRFTLCLLLLSEMSGLSRELAEVRTLWTC